MIFDGVRIGLLKIGWTILLSKTVFCCMSSTNKYFINHFCHSQIINISYIPSVILRRKTLMYKITSKYYTFTARICRSERTVSCIFTQHMPTPVNDILHFHEPLEAELREIKLSFDLGKCELLKAAVLDNAVQCRKDENMFRHDVQK